MLLHIILYICLKSLQKHIIMKYSDCIESLKINKLLLMKTLADFVKEKREKK